jgi:hypothetical protein
MQRYQDLLRDAAQAFRAWDEDRRPARYVAPKLCSCGCGRPRWNRTRWAEACYFRRRRQQLAEAQGRQPSYRHPPGTPLRCGHDAPHWAKGYCRPCYRRNCSNATVSARN